MAQLLNRLSETLHEATEELLDMFAINIDFKRKQASSEIDEADDNAI